VERTGDPQGVGPYFGNEEIQRSEYEEKLLKVVSVIEDNVIVTIESPRRGSSATLVFRGTVRQLLCRVSLRAVHLYVIDLLSFFLSFFYFVWILQSIC
jgi:hypothetical protein